MARKRRKTDSPKKKPPKVRLAYPANRPIQIRYHCPNQRREIRISTGTRDEAEALEQKRKIEAELLLGVDPLQANGANTITGPNMDWDYFREMYRSEYLATLGENSVADSESRLDIASRILKPRILADVNNSDALHSLQSKLLQGAKSRKSRGGRPRSPHTVR